MAFRLNCLQQIAGRAIVLHAEQTYTTLYVYNLGAMLAVVLSSKEFLTGRAE